jgi:hypothetical protein
MRRLPSRFILETQHRLVNEMTALTRTLSKQEDLRCNGLSVEVRKSLLDCRRCEIVQKLAFQDSPLPIAAALHHFARLKGPRQEAHSTICAPAQHRPTITITSRLGLLINAYV